MLELLILAALIGLNGVFALSELAIVSSRKSRLRAMAQAGKPGATTALALAEDPGKFLSTVQIGITLIGILAGTFSGATLGGSLAELLAGMGIAPSMATGLGYGGVVVLVTYFSVVLGELVPKQIALRNPENIATLVAPPMRMLSIIAAPIVFLLDFSTRMVFRLTGQSEVAESVVTEEEIKTLVAEAAALGVIESDEKRMIAGVLQLSDSTARHIMTPRTALETLSIKAKGSEIHAALRETRHTRIPVSGASEDDILGVVIVRECLAGKVPDSAATLKKFIRSVPAIPDTLGALDVLALLRNAGHPIALVHDEYGHFEGVVTPSDLLEAIAGVFASDLDADDHHDAVQREDGSWLLSGALSADHMADKLGIALPAKREYQTAAGFMITKLRHLPKTGEYLDLEGWRLEVVDMDGRRIDKIMATRLSAD